MFRAFRVRWLTVAILMALPAVVLAQRGGGFSNFSRMQRDNPPYNGQFTFTRIDYGFLGGSSAWNHDYPGADTNLPLILDAITAIKPNLHKSNIFTLTDPEIFKNPILYMWEPGGWRVSEEGATSLRNYLEKGGMIVFDDFEVNHWYNLEGQMNRVLPGSRWIELEPSHPFFHSFFSLDEINIPHPFDTGIKPSYRAIFVDDDPTKRMMALAFYNSDVAEYWEFSGSGRFPVDLTNDAYKLGVNYVVYGLTH